MRDMKDSEFHEEMKTALEAARKAGDIIDSYSDPEGWRKDDGSPVTEADIESQEIIVEKISEEFPEDSFLGEEEGLEPENSDRVWIIDPVDGTYNFKKGFGFHCVSLALEVDGELVLGVIHSPASSLGRTYAGARDAGALILEQRESLENGERLQVSDKDVLKGATFFCTGFEVYEGEFDLEKQVLDELVKRHAVHRQLGSCAMEMSFLASGRADLLVNPIAKKWDFAAGKVIVEEAGGSVRVRESRFPDSYEVVASNGELQQEAEEIVGDRFL